jgi:hypothetical protein
VLVDADAAAWVNGWAAVLGLTLGAVLVAGGASWALGGAGDRQIEISGLDRGVPLNRGLLSSIFGQSSTLNVATVGSA